MFSTLISDKSFLRKIHLEFFEDFIENFNFIKFSNDEVLDTIVSANYNFEIGILYLEQKY